MVRRFRNSQEWAKLVENWRLTGVSVKEFCHQEGISESRFYEVRKQVAAGIGEGSKENKAEKPQQFVPVHIKPTPELATQARVASYLEIVTPSGHMIRIH